MGCPGVKLAQGSSCHSHDPSSKSTESYPSDCETGEAVCKKFRSRYVYSAHCNATAVESLLAMSKHKAFRIFCGKVKSIPNGHPYSGGSIVNALKPCGNMVLTAKRSYPRSYAQAVKNHCKVDSKTSVNQVKGYESVVYANSCNSSGSRSIGVVNQKNAGLSTHQRSCGQVVDGSVNPLVRVTSKTPVDVIHHNCQNKGTAKVLSKDNYDLESTLSCQKSTVNSNNKVVHPQKARVQTFERLYSRDVVTPLQSDTQ